MTDETKPQSEGCAEQPPSFYPPREASGSEPDSGPGSGWIKRAPKPPVYVLLQPEEKEIEVPKAKTARAVLNALGLGECTAIIARDGQLLTPDRAVAPGDRLLVRKVTSSG